MTIKEKKIIKAIKEFYKIKLEASLKNIVEFEDVKKQYFKAANYEAAQTQNGFIQRFVGISGTCEEILKKLEGLNA